MVLCTACDPFTDRGCNVFLHKNTRRHKKSPNNNLRTFVEFLDQWIFALFRPARLRIFTLAPPRPSEKCSAPPIPGREVFVPRTQSLDCWGLLKLKFNAISYY